MLRSVTRGFWMAGGLLLVGFGLIVLPLPIPLGLAMIAGGVFVLTRHTAHGRLYWRQLKRAFPVTLGQIERARRAVTRRFRGR